MGEAIRVNFSKPLPLFPLPDAVLLPHAVLPLHIFESRYRQMICDCLDQSGQVAMASFETPPRDAITPEGDAADPPIRPIACIGQIVQHESLPDGRHNVLLHGVCRARIMKMTDADGDRLYRMASLRPIEQLDEQPPPMNEVRDGLRDLLATPRLSRLRGAETVLEWFDREDIPTHALLELIGFTLLRDPAAQYRLLAEPDPNRRARMIRRELLTLARLMRQAEHQSHHEWPKGMSWN